METMWKNFANNIWRIGAFKDVTKSPEGKGFRLKIHDKNPGAPLSPFYIDLRLLQSDLDAKRSAVGLFDELLTFGTDLLGAIPEAIVPVVSSLSDENLIPMITPRQPKSHGSGATIDGIYKPNDHVVLFDDVITGADSKIEAAKTLRNSGLVVQHVMVLADREQGGRQALAENGLTLHAAVTVTELLDHYRSSGMMSDEVYAQIQAYRGTVK